MNPWDQRCIEQHEEHWGEPVDALDLPRIPIIVVVATLGLLIGGATAYGISALVRWW